MTRSLLSSKSAFASAVAVLVLISGLQVLVSAEYAARNVLWATNVCAGPILQINSEGITGCQTSDYGSREMKCDNKTGAVQYTYPTAGCQGDWSELRARAVRVCQFQLVPFATFCGHELEHTLATAPVPAAVRADGVTYSSSSECDFVGGTCPPNSPVIRSFSQLNCQGKSRDSTIYTRLEFGKCYLWQAEHWSGYNVEAICDQSTLYVYSYNSGCHKGKDAVKTLAYRAGKCINNVVDNTSSFVVGC